MTDEERQRFARRLRERDAEIERLLIHAKEREDHIDAQRAEIERLRAALAGIIGATDLDEFGVIARRALEPKP